MPDFDDPMRQLDRALSDKPEVKKELDKLARHYERDDRSLVNVDGVDLGCAPAASGFAEHARRKAEIERTTGKPKGDTQPALSADLAAAPPPRK